MSAKVSSVFICPRCSESITSVEKVFACPGCALPLGKLNVEPYTPPYTFSEQHEKLKDEPALVEVVENLPVEKANYIMNDALFIVRLLAGKNTHVKDIRSIVKMAQQIGQIAVAYEKFLEAGGSHFPTYRVTQQQQQQQGIIDGDSKTEVARAAPASSPSDGRGGW